MLAGTYVEPMAEAQTSAPAAARARPWRTVQRIARWLFGPRAAWHFAIPSLALMALVGLATGLGVSRYVGDSIEAGALQHAAEMAEAQAYGHVIPHLSPDELDAPLNGEQYAEMDRFIRENVLLPGVVRIKIWNRQGTIIYSDSPSLMGRTFPIAGELAEALEGETAAEVSSLADDENVAERQYGRLLEVYTPIRFGDSPEVLGAFEVYQDYAPVGREIAAAQKAIYLGISVGLAFLYVVLFYVHRRGAAIIGRQREELVRRSEELKTSYEILEALSSALDLRDHATEGHCRRTAELAMIIARELGLSDEQVRQVGQAAFVHDIGKIGVPDAVLAKPESLTEEEWEQMRKHPELGYQMLMKVSSLGDVREIVRCHHERYDGEGYPRGLKGEEIPLGARIFALVDAYDAMTSHRPYRKACSSEDALAELRRCSGSQFDPQVVDAFVRAMERQPAAAAKIEASAAVV